MPLVEMKAFCKQNKCTINDFCYALLSTTLYEYMTLNSLVGGKVYEVPSTIGTGMPFSFRQPAKSIKDLRCNNDIVCLPVTIGIFKELNVALISMK